MQAGIVSKLYGTCYGIRPEVDMKTELQGYLRGRLRLRKAKEEYHKQRHLLAIGDRISFSQSASPVKKVWIEDVFERKNSLQRSSPHQIHCLGANVSRAVMVISMSTPNPHFGFLDRFLCAAFAGGVEPWIVFSKVDLLTKDKKSQGLRFLMQFYKSLGYTVFCLNLLSERDILQLKSRLNSGTTLLLGQSGVGKSTLINQILGQKLQKTQAVSLTTRQGKHTTTNACLYVSPTSQNAFLIDTPGLREWGLCHLQRKIIFDAFTEVRAHAKNCLFSDCFHQSNSIDCAVKKLLAESRQFFLFPRYSFRTKGKSTDLKERAASP